MSAISPLTNGSTTVSPPKTDAEKSTIDYTAFLKLFVAQLKNQDPLDPGDPSESLAQLASFSTVEQSVKLNSKLDQLISASYATVSGTLIGQHVSDLDGKISGIVSSIEKSDSGLIAILKSGSKLPLADGYRITSHE